MENGIMKSHAVCDKIIETTYLSNASFPIELSLMMDM